MTILGAGASYDSSPSHPLRSQFLHSDARLPLANQLFEDRATFVAALSEFPECHPIIPYLRRRKRTDSVEKVLQNLQSEAVADPQRYKQLTAIRYYLQRMLWNCEYQWTEVTKGVTNQTTLLDQVRHWKKSGEQVCFVTFNYDTLLERYFRSIGIEFNTLDSYIKDSEWKLIKLHGSVNWVREIETNISMANRGNGMEVAREIIDRADQIKVSQKYRIIKELPGGDRPEIGLFPALAIPVEGKSEYECPDDHIQTLKKLIPKVDMLLMIGWRAAEKPFIDLLSKGIKGIARGLVVSDSKKGGEETVANLKRSRIRCTFNIADIGFTEFTVGRSISALLG